MPARPPAGREWRDGHRLGVTSGTNQPPELALVPHRKVEATQARNSLEGTAQAFDSAAGVPGLPDWQAVPTPGHSPGHVAFFRTKDRVLITGDIVLTVDLNSVLGLLGRRRVAGPPYISTWNWPAAKNSVATLARLSPKVLACGHGAPMTGLQAAADLASLSDRLSRPLSRTRPYRGRAATTGRVQEPGSPAHHAARVSWNATEAERAMKLPGDDLVPAPVVQTTHAVTIGAPPRWRQLAGRAPFLRRVAAPVVPTPGDLTGW